VKVVFWGTYDLGRPRNRILIEGLRENGVQVIECHASVWEGVEDKSSIRSLRRRVRHGLRWLVAAYPRLCWRYLRLPRHDLVLVGYLGQLDVLVVRPLAWLRRVPLVWDTYLSLHDTVVDDRALIGPRHPLAWLLFAWEWLGLRAADLLLVDTEAHGRFFAERFGLPQRRLRRVFVGAEPRAFYPPEPDAPRPEERPYTVLFYGQFIPLHGMETIARAAHLCAEAGICWDVIGDGQDTERFRALLAAQGDLDLIWTPWVPYEELIHRIHDADLCLGIFGTSDKSKRVIPNKVFQVLAAGRALITADTPAARELLQPGPGVILVPSGNPNALADAICEMRGRSPREAAAHIAAFRSRITPAAIGQGLAEMLSGWLSERSEAATS
jgi:glycosyltransferase involved in cell wall biosynthesis